MSLSINVKGLKSVLNKLDPKTQIKVILRTTNRMGDRIFTQAKRQAVGPQGRYNLKGGQKTLALIKIKAKPSKLFYQIKAPTRPFSLIKFGAKWQKRGVKVTIVKGRTQVIENAFIRKPVGKSHKRRGQQRTVTATVGMVLRRLSQKAYPIEKLTSMNAAKMIDNIRAMRKYQAFINTNGGQIMQQNLDFILGRMK